MMPMDAATPKAIHSAGCLMLDGLTWLTSKGNWTIGKLIRSRSTQRLRKNTARPAVQPHRHVKNSHQRKMTGPQTL